jgi:VanZ family protein
MAVIFWFSAQTYDGHAMAWWEVAGRNLGHFGGYALLAAAWVWALGRLRGRLLVAAALSLAYAIADEYHQTFVEGRTGTAEDVVVDALGMATALLLLRRTQAAGPERY